MRKRRKSVHEAVATLNAAAASPTVICLAHNAMANKTAAFTKNKMAVE